MTESCVAIFFVGKCNAYTWGSPRQIKVQIRPKFSLVNQWDLGGGIYSNVVRGHLKEQKWLKNSCATKVHTSLGESLQCWEPGAQGTSCRQFKGLENVLSKCHWNRRISHHELPLAIMAVITVNCVFKKKQNQIRRVVIKWRNRSSRSKMAWWRGNTGQMSPVLWEFFLSYEFILLPQLPKPCCFSPRFLRICFQNLLRVWQGEMKRGKLKYHKTTILTASASFRTMHVLEWSKLLVNFQNERQNERFSKICQCPWCNAVSQGILDFSWFTLWEVRNGH